MPIWLVSALALIGSRIIPPITRLVGGRVGAPALALGAGVAGAEILGGGDVFPFFGGAGREGAPRRRRRRKALTNTDMKDALTIASAISKKAAENFILMRVRGT